MTEHIRVRPKINCEPGSSRTKQSFKDECDINILTGRWLDGVPMPAATQTPQYGDFSNADDYLTAVNKLNAANEQFNALPSKIRNRFDNEPGQLINFLADPANQEEAVHLGLADAPREEQPAPIAPAGTPTPEPGGISGGNTPTESETPT